VTCSGALPDTTHYDAGSLVTVDVMLSERGDFRGGEVATLECDGSMRITGGSEVVDAGGEAGGEGGAGAAGAAGGGQAEVDRQGGWQRGSALIFPSHKYHTVLPVRGGRRRVLVVEFWAGSERVCAHRCERCGPCGFTAAASREEHECWAADADEDADDWMFRRGLAGFLGDESLGVN